MAPHSSTLAWKIPWAEEPGRLQSMGHKGSDTTERLTLSTVMLSEDVRVRGDEGISPGSVGLGFLFEVMSPK